MTEKHIKDIAKSIKSEVTITKGHTWLGPGRFDAPKRIANSLANTFEEVNPQFNRAKFLIDCGF